MSVVNKLYSNTSYHSDGTALAPSIAFKNDDTTGIFSTSAGSMRIATSGTDRVVFDDTHVGINYTTALGAGGVGTGALTVAGGVDIGENLHVAQHLQVGLDGYILGSLDSGSLNVIGHAVIGGNLTVNGTTTSVNSENVLLADNYQLINSNYTAHFGSGAQTGGIVVNTTPLETFAAAISTINSVGPGIIEMTSPLSVAPIAGSFIILSGCSETSNNNIFEVDVGSTTTNIIIKSDPTVDFCASVSSMITEVSSTGSASCTSLSVLWTVGATAPGANDGTWRISSGFTVAELTTNSSIISGSTGVGQFTSLNLTDAVNQIVLNSNSPDNGIITTDTLTNGQIWQFPNTSGDIAIVPGDVGTNTVVRWDGVKLVQHLNVQQTTSLGNITNIAMDYLVGADQFITTTSDMNFKTIALDPVSSTGGGLVITNTITQTQGSLVSITGVAGQTALEVPTGKVLFDTAFIGNVQIANIGYLVFDQPDAILNPQALGAVNKLSNTGATTVNLPPSADFEGVRYVFVNTTNKAVTFTPDATVPDTVDEFTMDEAEQIVTIQLIGTKWYVV
jgi:hypothetical protein